MAEQQGNVDIQVRALITLAMVYTTRGEYAQERRVIERTLALAERIGDDSGVTLGILHLADNAFVTGDWRAAHELYERGHVLMRRADPWMWTALPAAALGMLAVYEGDTDAAGRYHDEVRQQGERGEEPLIWLEGALAERDLLAGRVAEAAACLKRLLEERHRSNTSLYELRALLGCILAHAGDVSQGEALADEVITRTRAEVTWPAMADAQRYWAWIAVVRGDLDAAQQALDQSLALARPMPRPYSEAKTLYVYGLLCVAQGDPAQARAHLEEALAICARLGERLYAEHIERALGALPR
jgi:tetratricopeptide (TPR) repeat protein